MEAAHVDGAAIRAFRQRWHITQARLAEFLSAYARRSNGKGWHHGDQSYSQQFVSQLERTPPATGKSGRASDWRPVPTTPREIGRSGEFDPSVYDELRTLLALPEDQVREWLASLPPPKLGAKGAYRSRSPRSPSSGR